MLIILNINEHSVIYTTFIFKVIFYDVHFWIWKHSTQDEYTVAAYKTVELDAYVRKDLNAYLALKCVFVFRYKYMVRKKRIRKIQSSNSVRSN